MESFSDLLGLGSGSVRILSILVVFLLLATLYRGMALRRDSAEERRERWQSAVTWWGLLLSFAAVLVVGRAAVVVVMAGVSLLVLRECLRLTGRPALFPYVAVVAAALYLWAWLDWRTVFLGGLPPLAVALLLGETVWRLRPAPRLAGLRALTTSFLAGAVGLSYVVAAAALPAPEGLPGTRLGWFVLLLVLTEFNDIAQAWWGRWLGSRPLAPVLSPRKTWEGMLGGVLTTAVTSVLLAPTLTSYGRSLPPALDFVHAPPWLLAFGVGIVVGLAGLAGDLAASSLKRRAKVKDSGSLLPGQGGVLDRFDSLTVSAPVFVGITYVLWFLP